MRCRAYHVRYRELPYVLLNIILSTSIRSRAHHVHYRELPYDSYKTLYYKHIILLNWRITNQFFTKIKYYIKLADTCLLFIKIKSHIKSKILCLLFTRIVYCIKLADILSVIYKNKILH